MRRTAIVSAWLLCGLLILVSLLAVGALIAGNSTMGRVLIERVVYRVSDGRVRLSGLGGEFPTHLTLEQLQLVDAGGVWLTAQHVSLDCSPLQLLRRLVQIDDVEAAKLRIERAPLTTGAKGGGSIPHIRVKRLSIAALQLAPALAGAGASLKVQGSLELRSLQDLEADVTARRTDGDGEYDLHAVFDAKHANASLNLHEPASGPLENLIGLPGLGALSATMTLTGPKSEERLELRLDAGDLHGRAQGRIDWIRGAVDVAYSVEAAPMHLRPDLSWQRIDLHAHWRGALTSLDGDGHLEVADLKLPGGTAIGKLDSRITATSGVLLAHAVAEGLEIPGSEPWLFQDGPVTIDATMRLNDPTRPLSLTATHRLLSVHADAVTAGRQSLNLDVRVPDVAPFAALGGQQVQGAASIQAQLTRDPAATRLVLAANGDLHGAAVWTRALGEHAALKFTGTLTDQALKVEQLQLSGSAGSASLSGSASRIARKRVAARVAPHRVADLIGEIRARFELDVVDLAILSPALGGTLRGSGEIHGAPTALLADAQLTSAVSVRGSPSGTLTAELHARGLPASPSGTLEMRGTVDAAPLRVDVAVSREDDGSLRALVRQADWKSAHLDGDVSIGTDLAHARGELRLQMNQLQDLKPLLGVDIKGSVAGSVAFKPAKDGTHAELQWTARDVVMGQFAGSAELSGEGRADALGLKLAVQLSDWHGGPVSLTSTALLNLDTNAARVLSGALDYHGQALALLSPAQVSFAGGVSVENFKLGAQHAILQIDGRVAPALDLRASLRDLDAALIDAFVPGLLAAGTVTGEAQLKGSLAAPTGEVRVEANGLRVGLDTAVGLPVFDLHAAAELSGHAAVIDARLAVAGASVMSITGEAPMDEGGTLDLKLNGKLDVGLANPWFEAYGQHVTGQLLVTAAVTGPAAAPQIAGTVRLAQGSFRDYSLGLNLSDISAEMVGNAGQLAVKSFTAGAAPGTVSMSGTIGVLQPGVPVDLKLTARNAQPIVSNLLSGNLNADLRVSGSMRTRLEVTGTVHLNRATIGIPSSMPPNVAVLDVRRRGQPAAPPEPPLIIGLDVAVEAPQQILVQGRGLDAELGGALHVGGTTDVPEVSGGFDLKRGNFSLASSRLMFTEGRVSFIGEGLKNKLDPTLDFTAQTTVLDATATLRITGLADAPQFDFSSSPPLPQDEIMSRLLFGEPASQLTVLQVGEIGAALATLGGVGAGGNPLAKLQKSLGLDRLSVSENTTPTATGGTTTSGAAIAAGRYLTKRVYLEAKQTTTGSSQVQVDVDLTKHLKLQTRLGNGTAIVQGTTPENDPGSSIGLSYQIEYGK